MSSVISHLKLFVFQHVPYDGLVSILIVKMACEAYKSHGGEWKVGSHLFPLNCITNISVQTYINPLFSMFDTIMYKTIQ